MIRTAAAALAVLALTAPVTAHANGKKPSPSQAAYDRAIANAKASAAAKAQAGRLPAAGVRQAARIRFGDKCDDLGSLFPPAGVGE